MRRDQATLSDGAVRAPRGCNGRHEEAHVVNIDRHLRRRVIAALCALLAMSMCALVATPVALGADAAVVSKLEGVQPPAQGLEVEVTGGDRFLVLTNGTDKEVVVKGYDDEPYLRFLPNRVVEVN